MFGPEAAGAATAGGTHLAGGGVCARAPAQKRKVKADRESARRRFLIFICSGLSGSKVGLGLKGRRRIFRGEKIVRCNAACQQRKTESLFEKPRRGERQ